MENEVELLYEMAAIVLFCLAITFFMVFYKETDRLLLETKHNIYDQHAIYVD